MALIRQATWPLMLKFRLPLDERDVFSLAKIADMRYLAKAYNHPEWFLKRANSSLRRPSSVNVTFSSKALLRMTLDFPLPLPT